MTHPDVHADRWTLPSWGWRRDTDWSLRLSGQVVDPLERAVLVAVVLLGAVLLWVLAPAQEASGTTAVDACVLTAVDDARDFAEVMGDDRAVHMSFAVRACAGQSG